jgi:hypothetical protein
VTGYGFEVRHGCDWEEYPVMDTNPQWHTRRCRICGKEEERWGPTVVPNGPAIPGTQWAERKETA